MGECLLEFLPEEASGRVRVPLGHGVHQGGVTVVAMVRIALAEVEQLDQVAQPALQHGRELGEQSREYGVVRGGDHGRVQSDVGVDELGVAPVRGVAALGQGGVEGEEVVVGAASGGQLCGFDLKQHAHFVDVGDGGLAQLGRPVLLGAGGDDEDTSALTRLQQMPQLRLRSCRGAAKADAQHAPIYPIPILVRRMIEMGKERTARPSAIHRATVRSPLRLLYEGQLRSVQIVRRLMAPQAFNETVGRGGDPGWPFQDYSAESPLQQDFVVNLSPPRPLGQNPRLCGSEELHVNLSP